MSDGKCFEVEVLAEQSSSVPGVGGVGEQSCREAFDQICRTNPISSVVFGHLH